MNFRTAFSKIFPDSGYRTPLLSYPALLVAMVAELVALASMGVHTDWDTLTYLDAADCYARGGVDFWRTPGYPLIIICVRSIVGSGLGSLYTAMNILQGMAMIAAAWYFRRFAVKVTGCGLRAAFWMTAVFCLLPQFQWHTMLVMTESLAAAGLVFMAYWMVRDLPGKISVRSGIMVALWLIFLIFLRPMMLCLIPVVGLWLIALTIRRGRRGRGLTAAWSGFAVCILAVASFTLVMNRVWGIHTFSGVTVINNFCTVAEAGIIYPQHTDNPALRTSLSRAWGYSSLINQDPLYIHIKYCPDLTDSITGGDLEALTARAASERPMVLVRHMWHRAWWRVRGDWLLTFTHIRGLVSLEHILVPRIGVYALFLLLYPLWMLRRTHRRERRLMWLPWGICLVMTVAAVIGAMDTWDRLLTPSIPFMIVIAGAPLSTLRYRPQQIL